MVVKGNELWFPPLALLKGRREARGIRNNALLKYGTAFKLAGIGKGKKNKRRNR